MEKVNVAIIGGSAAGITAAISSKRRNPDKTVMVIRQENQVLIPCGIPYIFGTLRTPQKNLIPDVTLSSNNVNLIIDTAKQIDRDRKMVLTARGQVSYDKLIIATGSLPAVLPIPGIDKENVFLIKKEVAYLQNMLDKVNQAKEIIIIGGGFIGAQSSPMNVKKDEITTSQSSRSYLTACSWLSMMSSALKRKLC